MVCVGGGYLVGLVSLQIVLETIEMVHTFFSLDEHCFSQDSYRIYTREH